MCPKRTSEDRDVIADVDSPSVQEVESLSPALFFDIFLEVLKLLERDVEGRAVGFMVSKYIENCERDIGGEEAGEEGEKLGMLR